MNPITAGTDLVPAGQAAVIPSAAGESPFRRPGSFGRRPLLAGLLGLGLGAALDAAPFTSWTALAAPPKVGAGAGWVQPTPYAVLASSELADEILLTSDVLIGADHRVMPFVNPHNNNAVEALVFTGSSLHHLRRDPTVAAGWVYQDFDLQETFTSVTDVAIAAGNGTVYALIVGDPDPRRNTYGSPFWLTYLDDAVNWHAGFLAPYDDTEHFPPNPGPLKGGVSREGIPYFYTFAVNGGSTDVFGWISNGGEFHPLDYRLFLTLDTSAASTEVKDFLILYDTNATDTVGYALILTAGDGTHGGALDVYQQDGKTFTTAPDQFAGVASGVSDLLWAWASPSAKKRPGYAIQGNFPTLGEGTFFCDEAGNFDKLADQPGVGPDDVTVWLQNGRYAVNLLDSNGNLQTVQQVGPGQWGDPLPVTRGAAGHAWGLTSVFGVPTDPREATLFAIGADETLSVLTLDGSGWSQTQVRQDDTEASSITCYRVKMNVVDSNGTPVPYAQAQISTDRPVGLWQDVGSTIITPAAPVTMTADILGEISASVPAEELDVAVLTVQALDATAQPSGPVRIVKADTDVRNFLGGSAPLNQLGTMSGSTLTAAKNWDGSPVFSHLAPADADGTAAMVQQSIAAGNKTPPAAGAPHSLRLERRGQSLKLSTSSDPAAFKSSSSRPLVGSSLSQVFHTLGHAIRHDVATVSATTFHWVAASEQWAVDLAVMIGDDVQHFTDLVIADMRDAFHIIGGWFATLGGDIVSAVNWLRREVLHFLAEVGGNAAMIETWLLQAPDVFTTVINGLDKTTDNWFEGLETKADDAISYLEGVLERAVFGSYQPTAPDRQYTGGSSALQGLGKDLHLLVKVVNDCPGKWLYDKLMQYLPQTPGPNLDGVFDDAINTLASAFVTVVDSGEDIVRRVYTAMGIWQSTEALTQASMSQWFEDMRGIVHDALAIAQTIADAVLHLIKDALAILGDYLRFPWPVGSISPILSAVLDLLKVNDPTVTLARLVSLVVAFPATLVSSLFGRSSLFPADPAQTRRSGRVGSNPDGWQEGLGVCTAITQIIWTTADAAGDVERQNPAGSTSQKRPQQPGFVDYFDILCPIVETVLSWPSRAAGGNTSYPFHGGLATDTTDWEILPFALFTTLMPPMFGIADKAKKSAGTGEQDPNVIKYHDDTPAGDPYSEYYGPVVGMLSAIANAVLNGTYSGRNADSVADGAAPVTAAVLGNLPNIAAPFATKWLNESLEDLPVVVKLLIDAVGGYGAAIAIVAAST